MATRRGRAITEEARLEVRGNGPEWVSRAARKLLAAIDGFGPEGLSVQGRTTLDAGASTGGFTQVLLHHGASRVISVDVGHGQLAAVVRADPRVTERSGTSVRGLTPEDVGGPVDLLVADLSFISQTLVLADLVGLVVPGGDLVVLVKPQFEVGRERLGKNGVVRDAADRTRALTQVAAAARAAGAGVRGLLRSPVQGAQGNTEYLMWLTRGSDVGMSWQALVRMADHLGEEEPR